MNTFPLRSLAVPCSAALLAWLLSLLGRGSQLDMVVNGLHPKLSPFVLVEDGDPTDVKLRDRVRFKPSPHGEEGLDRRFVFQARVDGAAASLRHSREITGDATVWARVAVDQLDGLSGAEEGGDASQFFLCCIPGADEGGGMPTIAVEALWNAAIAGLTARATVDGVPAGTAVDFAGQKEIFVVGERLGGVTSLYAAQAVDDAFDGFGPWQLLHSVAADSPEGVLAPFSLDVGARNLGRGARFYVTQVTTRVVPGAAASTSAADTSLAETLIAGLLPIDVVDTLLFFPTPHDLDLVLASLQAARLQLDAAFALVAAGPGAFLPETPFDTVVKWMERADVALDKAIPRAEELVAQQATSALPLKKVVNQAQTGFRIALGQLFGFKTESLAKLNRAVDLD